jgi:hypothetical protein
MALTFDPETGEPTTTALLAAREERRERAERVAAIDRRIHDDAINWRLLVGRIGRDAALKLLAPAPKERKRRA